jgi:hypothetical protein
MPKLSRAAVAAMSALLVCAASANAATFGSSLDASANAGFGCESALRPDPFSGAPVLVPTGHRTCTLRSNGRVNSNRNWSAAPATGRVTRYAVRAGRNPARLRLTILSGSLQVDPTGETSNYSCCTARRFGPVFRPRANRVTRRRTNMRVFNYRRRDGRQFFDLIGLTAVGPGSLPLHTEGRHFSFQSGSAITTFYYPHTRRGEPRPESNAVDGLQLLLRWTWRR